MPSFPCDNSGDFIPDEMYDSVRLEIETQQKQLGRMLTEEEIAAIYEMDGLEPPGETYPSRNYGDFDEDDETSDESTGTEEDASPQVLIENQDEQTVAQTITQQNSENESEDIENLSPRAAEYFRILQQISQKSGVTATLAPQKRDHSTTTKTRFVFMAGQPQTDSEQKPTDQQQTK